MKKKSARDVDELMKELRNRRLEKLKERVRVKGKNKQVLSKDEIKLWESEKRLIRSQKRLTLLEEKLKMAQKDYQADLRKFIDDQIRLFKKK